MPDVIVPLTNPATQVERRCSRVMCLNNLDTDSTDPTVKYRMLLSVCDEPQDAAGNKVGGRSKDKLKLVPMAEALSRNFTAAGVTLPGIVVLALLNEVIDAYKGD